MADSSEFRRSDKIKRSPPQNPNVTNLIPLDSSESSGEYMSHEEDIEGTSTSSAPWQKTGKNKRRRKNPLDTALSQQETALAEPPRPDAKVGGEPEKSEQPSKTEQPIDVFSTVETELHKILTSQRTKLSTAGMEKIISHVASLKGVIIKVLEENAFLKGRLAERSESEQILKTVQKTVEKQATRPVTYAAAASPASILPVTGPGKSTFKPREESRNTLLIFPKEKLDGQSSQLTEALVKKAINPQDLGLKIKRISKIRNNGIAVELQTASQLDKLQSEPKLSQLVQMNRPRKRFPKVLIYDVPQDLTDQQLTEKVYLQNVDQQSQTLGEFSESFKPLFKTGPRSVEVSNWVVEVHPRIRNQMLRDQRVFISWSSCKVIDHHIVSRCYKCQRYGHMAKDCKSLKDVCGHCATEGHITKNCPNKNDATKAKCVCCSSVARRGAGPMKAHASGARDCPAYLAEVQKLISMTDYGT